MPITDQVATAPCTDPVQEADFRRRQLGRTVVFEQWRQGDGFLGFFESRVQTACVSETTQFRATVSVSRGPDEV